jgi:hypothetical protein
MNSKNFFLLFLIFFLIFIIIYSLFYKIETFDTNNNNKLPVLIISRYSETLDWLHKEYVADFPNIIYNKGSDDNYEKNANTLRTVNADNLGRCDGTYVRYIVENYDDLPEVMVFLPGSANMDNKYNKLIKLIEKVRGSENSSVYVNYPDPGSEPPNLHGLYNFQLDHWSSSNSENNQKNSETVLTPAKIRPYGKWYEHHFGEFDDHSNTGIFGLFAVSKMDVLKRPKEFYQDLLEQLEVSSNPEVGHYCERCWAKIFNYTGEY